MMPLVAYARVRRAQPEPERSPSANEVRSTIENGSLARSTARSQARSFATTTSADRTTAVARIRASGVRSAVAARMRAASRAMSNDTGAIVRLGKLERNASTVPTADEEPARNGRTSASVTEMADTRARFRPEATNPSMMVAAAPLVSSPPPRYARRADVSSAISASGLIDRSRWARLVLTPRPRVRPRGTRPMAHRASRARRHSSRERV